MKIGITGHQERSGIDWAWVSTHIDRYLNGKVGVIGYSSLAAGTDQIFAELVLSCGGKLVAVIPVEDYSEFFNEEALAHFSELLSKAQAIELKSNKADERAFLDAGKWIARETDRLIAVWDGKPAEGPGGTGDIVAYALSLGRAVHHIDPLRKVITDL